MFQNVLLFIHLKMFKICCMLNVIYCNKLCVACCSVWHRTTTVHWVILMWITFCKINWVFAVNCMISSTVMWACCNVQHLVANHTEKSNFSGTKSSTAFSLHWWMTSHVFIQKNALLTHILSTLFSSTSVLFSCTPFGIYIYVGVMV